MKSRIAVIAVTSALVSSLAQAKDVCARNPQDPTCISNLVWRYDGEFPAALGAVMQSNAGYSQWDIYAYEIQQPDVTVTLHCHGHPTEDRTYMNTSTDQTTITVSCKGAAK